MLVVSTRFGTYLFTYILSWPIFLLINVYSKLYIELDIDLHINLLIRLVIVLIIVLFIILLIVLHFDLYICSPNLFQSVSLVIGKQELTPPPPHHRKSPYLHVMSAPSDSSTCTTWAFPLVLARSRGVLPSTSSSFISWLLQATKASTHETLSYLEYYHILAHYIYIKLYNPSKCSHFPSFLVPSFFLYLVPRCLFLLCCHMQWTSFFLIAHVCFSSHTQQSLQNL